MLNVHFLVRREEFEMHTIDVTLSRVFKYFHKP
jgi:hypothetical protein